ncbi:MAG: bifunctional alpha,alpha-trehalose-phosphate synthase (UDP-forming)/trehalose-phosphatase [Candidatus Marinimicrobia bacterium]|nr:bifunctional alpha,alpha-trehalose-phosphate synthase (UDP-forming)/trehalose-phosphatase [Candidatus Neomarinimicrobiota bacterium]MCF7840594.1 bifunctional alpha,alpha-trehalose-phosphate synthase (UDP-forming)/trehalose-phosphatase [Candidatus Neomarinimicrobiota bacterium]
MNSSEKKIILVSNRLPVSVVTRGKAVDFTKSAGGLATGLDSIYREQNSIWVGWPGISKEKAARNQQTIREKLAVDRFHSVFLAQKDLDLFYNGFCNNTLWPLFVYFTQHVKYDSRQWDAYVRANQQFCDEVLRISEPEDTIWVHDYHFMLLPRMLREKRPDQRIGFFLHIPWPASEIYRELPWRDAIIDGVLGADLVGLHTNDYVTHFLHSVRRLTGIEHYLGTIRYKNRDVKADSFPMGIDYHKFSTTPGEKPVQREIKKIKRQLQGEKIILSVDRLDYTKGILERLEAYELFLKRYPKYREKVVFIIVAVPSRTKVESYQQLKRHVDERVGEINGRFGTLGWVPIWYLYKSIPFHRLIALYRAADIGMVTPIRDGMNLVAKEFLAANEGHPAVLILSERAGAERELGEALVVNPNDIQGMAESIKSALELPRSTILKENAVMQERIKRYDARRWAADFLERLDKVVPISPRSVRRALTPKIRNKLLNEYRQAESRLILLDYDGTLTGFYDKPEAARPGRALRAILRKLTADDKNSVAIVSGRDRQTLDDWLGDFDLNFIAEHGVWLKPLGEPWRLIEPLRSDWKASVRPLMEHYIDRTPGAILEEKDFSLVWHCRRVDSEFASRRTLELMEDLVQLTAHLSLNVLQGHRVIEVKNANVDKGRAVAQWLNQRDWDFILSIGDDWTDEDVFRVLPDHGWSIRVGDTDSHSKYWVPGVDQVLSLLDSLIGNQTESR